MKRDMDLARKIMLAMDADDYDGSVNIQLDGHTAQEIGFHSHLLAQAGLIEAIDVTTMSDFLPSYMPRHLTWEGYEFIGSVKDPTAWESAKKHVVQPAGGIVFSLLKDWAKMELKAKLGIP